jgi:hypothetical protein
MSFRQARLVAGKTPPIRELPAPIAMVALTKGALVLRNALNEWAECGVDPALIGGVALHAYGVPASPIGGHGREEFPPGQISAMLVQDDVEFVCEFVGAVGVEGTNYGVTRGLDLIWRLDFAKVGAAARFTYVRRLMNGPTPSNLVVVKAIPANVQIV